MYDATVVHCALSYLWIVPYLLFRNNYCLCKKDRITEPSGTANCKKKKKGVELTIGEDAES